MNFTRQDCDNLLKPLLQLFLPKARINRNFNRTVLRAPGGWMGLEIPCMYTNQVIQHIDCLLRHGGTNTITGQLLKGTIEQAKVEIRVCGNLLTQPFNLYGYLLTDCWIKGVWQEVFLASIHVIEQTVSLKPKQDNDILLIKQFTYKG